jgi:toxin ParE1/3/4
LTLVWLPTAIRNRRDQLAHIAHEAPLAAIEQGDRLEHQVAQLIQHPELGRAGRKRGTRELVISRTPFVVVYRFKPRLKRVEILRVLHHAQQWPSPRTGR